MTFRERYSQLQTKEELIRYVRCDFYISCLCGYNADMVEIIAKAANKVAQERGWDLHEYIKGDSEMSDYDPVNKPEHYANTKVECIDAMEEVFGKERVMIFSLLNCYKYLWRRKDKDNEEQDIRKALWYFDKYKELLNRE